MKTEINLVMSNQEEMINRKTFKEVDKVLKFRDALKLSILPKEEERKLLQQAQNGDKEAKDILILHNLNLVVFFARRYNKRGIPMDDLIQEGIIGLIKAIDKFDLTKKNTFSTYAYWWIRWAIENMLASQSKSVAIERTRFSEITKIINIENELAEKLEHYPTEQELAEYLKISIKQLQKLRLYDYKEISIYSRYDSPILETFLPDESITSPAEAVNQKALNELIEKSLSYLPDREKKIIMLRFGLDGKESYTLQEISKMIGISHVHVSRLEKRALQNLKLFAEQYQLEDYIDRYQDTKILKKI